MKRILTAVFSTALIVGLGAPAANADTEMETITLRDGDVAVNAVGDGGADFFRDGLHLFAGDGGGVGVETPVNKEFREIATGLDYRYVGGVGYETGVYVELDLGYSGDTGEPDGEVDVRLTYEHTYDDETQTGGLWLGNVATPAGEELKQAAIDAGMTGHGYQFGSWEQWQDLVTANTEVANVGTSLGLPGDGVLKWITLDSTQYRFTSDAAPLPQAKPVVTSKIVDKTNVHRMRVKVHVYGDQPEGTVQTPKGAYYRVVKFNPRTKNQWRVDRGRVSDGDHDRTNVRFGPRRKRAMVVKVISYGDVIERIRLHPKG